MNDTIEIKYKGSTITYSEYQNEWSVMDEKYEFKASSLEAVKKSMDEKEKRVNKVKKAKFEPVTIYKYPNILGDNDKLEKFTITSIADDGECWATGENKNEWQNRRKRNNYWLSDTFLDTKENHERWGKIKQLSLEISKLEKDMTRFELKGE